MPADRCIELDLKQLAASSHLAPRNLRSPLAREISAIKRALEPSITDARESRPEGPLLVAVTSTNPGEGKSFLSFNLGFFYLFSEVRPVLLVDIDTIACGLSRSLGVADRSGLAERVPEQLRRSATASCRPGGSRCRSCPQANCQLRLPTGPVVIASKWSAWHGRWRPRMASSSSIQRR